MAFHYQMDYEKGSLAQSPPTCACGTCLGLRLEEFPLSICLGGHNVVYTLFGCHMFELCKQEYFLDCSAKRACIRCLRFNVEMRTCCSLKSLFLQRRDFISFPPVLQS